MTYDDKFEVISRFIAANPNVMPKREAAMERKVGLEKLKEKFIKARGKPYIFKTSDTVPDSAVSYILGLMEGYKEDELDLISQQHKESMAAENIIGLLLEGYIASELEPHGWVNASGNVLRAIDFVKEVDGGNFIALQIKNRDNTENSSSSAIREGTTIKKWHRTFSKKTDTNWDNFPEDDLEIRSNLSEEGFKNFIKKELRSSE